MNLLEWIIYEISDESKDTYKSITSIDINYDTFLYYVSNDSSFLHTDRYINRNKLQGVINVLLKQPMKALIDINMIIEIDEGETDEERRMEGAKVAREE